MSCCLRIETPPTWMPGSFISIPQEQCGPVTPPGSGFPFRRLLRFAGLRWRYSTPIPLGDRDSRQPGPSFYSFGADHTENIAPKVPVVSCLFVAAEKCLPRRCLVMTASSFSTIPAFSRHVTTLRASIILPPRLLKFFMADGWSICNFTLSLFHVNDSQSVSHCIDLEAKRNLEAACQVKLRSSFLDSFLIVIFRADKDTHKAFMSMLYERNFHESLHMKGEDSALCR
jgi:hypothetical protein